MTEKENAAASGVPSPSLDGGGKAGRMSESGRGGRKKYLSGLYICSFVDSFMTDYFTSSYLA